MADVSLFPTYLTRFGEPRASFQSGGSPQAEPKPFDLRLAQPPAINVPPLNSAAPVSTNAVRPVQPAQPALPRAGVPRAAAAAVPDNGLPKGVPSNAIPVIRGTEVSYDIPGTGQRLYPTLGGVSEFSPDQRAELARFVEPAQIGAEASVKSAGIRAGADVASTLGAARLAQEGSRFRTLAELGATPRPFGAEPYTNEFGQVTALPTYGVPKINTQTGAVEGFTSIGEGARRQANTPQEGATGTYNGNKVVYRNGKWVSSGN